MQALRFPPPHQRKTDATRCNPLPTLTPREYRLGSPGGRVTDGAFQLIVRCAPSQEPAVGPLVRDALADLKRVL